MRQHYSWQRYWCPRESNIDLFDRGYLPDPDAQWGKFSQQQLKTLDEILAQMNSGCVILLGEPGLGKTTIIDDMLQQKETQLPHNANAFLSRNLSIYSSDALLVHDLFGSSTYTTWKEGKHRLTLILDAFDECLIRIDSVANLLISRLKDAPIERLLLCIACRTAIWPTSFEQKLRSLWERKQQPVGVYTLAPLRRRDILNATRQNGIATPEVFLQKVDQAHIVPFAIKPLTLDIIIQAYQQTGTLLMTQQEVYHKGCLTLCTENPERDTPLLKGKLIPQERLVVAARLAALMLFTNMSTIWRGQDQSERSEADLLITQCTGYAEEGEGKQLHVTPEEIEEVLNTGLFTSRGPTRMEWAHKTYAEYLAAYYLTQHNLPLNKIESLITHPDDPDRKIIPQLNETAAWLATMQPDLFSEMLHRDPETLIANDVITTGERERRDLVTALFQGNEEQIQGCLRLPLRTYTKLAHAQIEQQLRSYIQTATYPLATRLLAIHIADACAVKALQHALVASVLDPSEALQLREDAAHAIVHIGDAAAKAQLKTFALQNHDDDEYDQLKGYGFQATWPDQMTATELFAALTRPKQSNFFGAYRAFLVSSIADNLQTADIPQALTWIEQQQQEKDSHDLAPYAFQSLHNAILQRVWDHLDGPSIVTGFARVILTSSRQRRRWITTDQEKFTHDLMQDEAKRHRLHLALFTLMVAEPDQYQPTELSLIEMVTYSPALFFEEDFTWMLAQLTQASATPEILALMAQLIRYRMNIDDQERMDAIIRACEHSPLLTEILAPRFGAVALNSVQAERMKEEYQWTQHRKRPDSKAVQNVPPQEQIQALLHDCIQAEQAEITLWARLINALTVRPDGSFYTDSRGQSRFNQDTFPGWDVASTSLKEQLTLTAIRYLSQYRTDTSANHRRETSDNFDELWITYTLYKTLQLLYQEAPQHYHHLPISTWEQVAPALFQWSDPHSTVDQQLLAAACRHAPSQVRDTIRTMLAQPDRWASSHLISIIEVCWNDHLAHLLLTYVQEPACPPERVGSLLSILLQHQVANAEDMAMSFIPTPLPDDENVRAKAREAAQALLTSAQDAGWPHLWPLIQIETSFGELLFSQFDTDLNIAGMTDQQVADLYLWLVQHFPPQKREQERTQAEHIGAVERLQNNLIASLQQRGTFSACAAIRFLIKELPDAGTATSTLDLPYLPAVLSTAQTLARRNTWLPLRPQEFLQLLHQFDTRLVENGDQLLEVLLASFERLEAKLQGETPAAIDLWNTSPIYTPKDENDFSDYVKRHLDEDVKQRGIIANREVELRPHTNKDGAPGERTDIHVDAVIRRSTTQKQAGDEIYDSITVIIETKGCWHSELKTAMQTQLVERYLTENPSCHHGLYLIGWFACPQWDATDPRHKQTQRLHLSLEEARSHFAQQAHELSQGDVHVKAYVMNTALRAPSKKHAVQDRSEKTATGTSSIRTRRNKTKE